MWKSPLLVKELQTVLEGKSDSQNANCLVVGTGINTYFQCIKTGTAVFIGYLVLVREMMMTKKRGNNKKVIIINSFNNIYTQHYYEGHLFASSSRSSTDTFVKHFVFT